jgi:tetratricopeptide (TPR) repeat protein
MRGIRLRRLAFGIGAIFLGLQSPTFADDLPRALEPAYGEAVLAYHAKDYARALELISELERKAPRSAKLLELQALCYKTQGRDELALPIYQRLVSSQLKAGQPTKGAAPFLFEIGMIEFRRKNLKEARRRVQSAINLGFNLGASHFFLGTIDFQGGDLASADQHFRAVLDSDAASLKPMAELYLGQIASMNYDAEAALRSFVAAKEGADATIADPNAIEEESSLARQVSQSTSEVLSAFNFSKFFGSVSLLSSYDSNVLSVPTSGVNASAAQAQGYGSAGGTLKVGLGYSSPPLDTVQFIPSYQGSINFESNSRTDNGEFILHDLALYLNRHPYATTSYGFKIEGLSYFQYEASASTGPGKFGPYSLGGSFGPYWRTEIRPKVLLGFESFFEPVRNFLDPAFSPPARLSGWDALVRSYLRQDSHGAFWNPGAAVTLMWTRTEGTEYQSAAATLGLSDLMYPSDRFTIANELDIGYAHFPNRPEQARTDENFNFQIRPNWRLSRSVLLIGEVQYIVNVSNIKDAYQYNRMIVSAGPAFEF